MTKHDQEKDPEPQPKDPDDIFGSGQGPMAWSLGPGVSKYRPKGDGVDAREAIQNAYDETIPLEDWLTKPLSMEVPMPDEPVTCEDICKKKHKDADEKCSAARKRIELGLKKAGCPSKVLAVKRKTPCGGGGRKKATKPKARAARRAR